MKTIVLRTAVITLITCLSIIPASRVSAQEILRIPSFDGVELIGRLNMPSDGFAGKIVIDVPGTGPHTYLNRRKIGRSLVFNFHDYFAEEFNRRGIAYFSYNTRYTQPDTIPPTFDKVNREKFFTYTPSIKIRDLEEIVKFLREDPRLQSSRIILLGQSEGAIIAAQLVANGSVPVDALLLCGTPTEDVYSLIQWQLSGESSMINMRKFFDTNGDSVIQKQEYENGDPRALRRVGGASFANLDVNRDSVLTADDFGMQLQPTLEAITSAIENDDDEWIWNNFFRVGTAWIKEHRTLAPNSERILSLDIPVYLFHGEEDANCPVEGIRRLKERAGVTGKTNIHVYTFAEHDHSLEFLAWAIHGAMPEGLQRLFETADSL
ncbi:hypothetical protein GF420_00690 [candidate division GN15 bacterium]|nr:hypothetical protein [candidate division GN15 bacterium]